MPVIPRTSKHDNPRSTLEPLKPIKADQFTLQELAIARMAVRAELRSRPGQREIMDKVCERLGCSKKTTHTYLLALLDECIDQRKQKLDAVWRP